VAKELFAILPFSATVPNGVAPAVNVTVPVGMAPAEDTTPAVKVTGSMDFARKPSRLCSPPASLPSMCCWRISSPLHILP